MDGWFFQCNKSEFNTMSTSLKQPNGLQKRVLFIRYQSNLAFT